MLTGLDMPSPETPSGVKGIQDCLAIPCQRPIGTWDYAYDDAFPSVSDLNEPEHAVPIRRRLDNVVRSHAAHEPRSVVQAEQVPLHR
jgi:hypothetical protein